jgi:Xaa-Pro aminopeptidase
MTPIAFGYAIIEKNGDAKIFIKKKKLSKEVLVELKNDEEVTIHEPSELPIIFKKLSGQKILFDEDTINIALIKKAGNEGIKPYIQTDPIYLMKSQKNKIELNGVRAAHLRDSTAVIKFMRWFLEADVNKLTEWTAAKYLESEREKLELYQGPSFPTISATGKNAAEAHYQLNKKTAGQLKDGQLFLFDSGGQFLDGTTDITRVLAVGTPTMEMKFNYTLVLKGHISIHLARFPSGTTGQQLDPLARQFLWSEGLDYEHGTGHGVGHYLSVHEGPQRISKTSKIPLEIGMILSNEPGFYKENSYGIRIENLLVVKEIQGSSLNSKKSIYGFETLSFVPYDLRLINKEQLEPREINWINGYHAEIIKKMSPLLDIDDRKFLQSIARMI